MKERSSLEDFVSRKDVIEGGPERGMENKIEKERRKGTKVCIDLMRHSDRYAGSGKWSDPESGEVVHFEDSKDLTPTGKARAEEYGRNLPSDVDIVIGVASMEDRAAETSEDVKKGRGQTDEIPGSNQVFGITYTDMSRESQAEVKKASALINEEAAKYPNYGRLTPELRSVVRHGAQEVGLREAMKKSEYIDESAEGVGYNLWILHEISEHAPTRQVTSMPIVNHGGFNESFLLRALVVEDEKTGEKKALADVDELGGFFKTAESFRVTVEREGGNTTYGYEFTNPDRQKLFEGKRLSLDWDEVHKLHDAYEKRLNKDGS